ncbi:MAG: 5-amino-6-(D-ribitylamino)uracil--L-tyrosine 4-hydroxyphenyl transferase CofH [Gammaproteobacteria bacterium]
MNKTSSIISKAGATDRLSDTDCLALADCTDTEQLCAAARELRDSGYPDDITYSPKVFIPLTQLCRDVCHYCTFAHTPEQESEAYLSEEQVLAIARAGQAAGCHEALFTLGDKPELRYPAAREALQQLGHDSTLSYLAAMAQRVLDETGLLPHLNPGVVDQEQAQMLRRVSVSQGLMLESSAERLCEKGGPHYGSPDKAPATRLAAIAAVGAAAAPLTSGILIGIGETRDERIASLLALRELHEAGGHIQEIIIQNFRRKPGTKMQLAPEPDTQDMVWTIAVARLIFGSAMSIQAPPNLSPDAMPELIRAGINDWGGVSPVTPDHVNPEAAWPHLDALRRVTEAGGKQLTARLPVYPDYIRQHNVWLDANVHKVVLRHLDAQGYARSDDWAPGETTDIPFSLDTETPVPHIGNNISRLVDRAGSGMRLQEKEIARLFSARAGNMHYLCQAADEMRAALHGDTVTYVVNRNINYTNICYFGCGFCAFSKGKVAENLRERGYDLPLTEIQQRVREAWERGATEVCLQGGIHPDYTGETYLAITRAVKQARPGIHVHAFSPLEVSHGADTLGVSVQTFLQQLKLAGLDTLPGTAAEILDDEIRQIICADKLSTDEWLNVVGAAHREGFTTTATIMFGHVDAPLNWARHLLRIRDLQEETGGFSEFVPLPYVHREAPLYKKGRSRIGPTFREALLMHAVARLVLYPLINNIQASWVKLGPAGVRETLRAGVNDLGGTLMNESISRAAGASHGQEFSAAAMQELIRSAGRVPQQRGTLYQPISATDFGTADTAA